MCTEKYTYYFIGREERRENIRNKKNEKKTIKQRGPLAITPLLRPLPLPHTCIN
jgi:hypothetical protein